MAISSKIGSLFSPLVVVDQNVNVLIYLHSFRERTDRPSGAIGEMPLMCLLVLSTMQDCSISRGTLPIRGCRIT